MESCPTVRGEFFFNLKDEETSPRYMYIQQKMNPPESNHPTIQLPTSSFSRLPPKGDKPHGEAEAQHTFPIRQGTPTKTR